MQHPGKFVEFAKYLERHDFKAIPPTDYYWPTHSAAIKAIHGRFRIGSFVDPDNMARTIDILVDDIWYTKDCSNVPFWDFTTDSAFAEGERLILQLREVVFATRDYACYVLDPFDTLPNETLAHILSYVCAGGCHTRYGKVAPIDRDHLDCLAELVKQGHELDDEWYCSEAARGGHLEVLKWLWANQCPWDEEACAYAAEKGNLEVLKWLRANGCPWDEDACSYAVQYGHLEVLKWLQANGCPWDEDACAYAAQYGQLEVLKWLRANQCPWDEEACSSAAWKGHLEVLKWLQANGCPWDEEACAHAAAKGQLEVLKWLRANGCPWDKRACAYAAQCGHLEVLKWLQANGCPE